VPAKHTMAIRATRNYAAPDVTHRRQKHALAERVIVLEDLDFAWTKEQVARFREMWKAGVSLEEMAERLRRDLDEVALLAMHERRQGNIEPRPGGWKGDG